MAFWDDLKRFHEVFVPLFVAMDPLGLIPFLLTLLEPIQVARRRRVLHIALLTGLVLGLLFLGLGRGLLLLLDIQVSHFLVAGGTVLLVVSLRDLLAETPQVSATPNEMVAVVPIGTPLLVGPATISMLMLLTGLYPAWLVVGGFLANMVIAWAVFGNSFRIAAFLGRGGLLAFARVAYLLLAAIAVKLISQGVIDIVNAARQAG
ncbi:MAG: MarC family protein [Gemmatimonadetes bacterium]|nr:MarC family protein [Gemmatimonadota bacterium]